MKDSSAYSQSFPATQSGSLFKWRILIIDDEPAVCTMLRDGFELAGYEVMTASNGIQGLRLYCENSPHLVITDLLLPEMDGLEIIREILSKHHEAKIIAISGGHRVGLDFFLEAELFGAVRGIAKPFGFQEILSVAEEVLSQEKEKPS